MKPSRTRSIVCKATNPKANRGIPTPGIDSNPIRNTRHRNAPMTPPSRSAFQQLDHAFISRADRERRGADEPHLHEQAGQHAPRASATKPSRHPSAVVGGAASASGGGGRGEVLQPRGLQPARRDCVARVPAHRGLRARGSGLSPRGGGGGARAAAGEALRPPLGRQLGGWGCGGGITRVPAGRRGIRRRRRRRIPDLRGREGVGNASAGFEKGELGMGIRGRKKRVGRGLCLAYAGRLAGWLSSRFFIFFFSLQKSY